MSESEYAKAVAEFMSRKGVTRCPTVCAVPTHASIAAADRQALRRRAEEREARIEERRQRDVAMYRFGHAA